MSAFAFDEHFIPPCYWDEYPRTAIKAYIQWLTSHIRDLTVLLNKDVSTIFPEWTADYSATSVESVERWLELTAAGTIERQETVLLDEGTERRAFRAGIYLGASLVHTFGGRWDQQLKNKRDVLYGHALPLAVDGFVFNPVGVARATAMCAVLGLARAARFTSMFEKYAKTHAANVAATPDAVATSSQQSVSREGRRVPTGDPKRVDADLETWVRDLDEADEDLRQVDVIRESGSPRWAWRVVVALAEFVRDPDGESALVSAVESALLRARGALKVVQQDREVWLVAGTSTGEQLVAALAPAIDALAAAYSASDEAED